jgi:hypothetical protein
MMGRRALVTVALLAVSLVLATTAFANHSWNGYHWARTSNPFTLQLETDLSVTKGSDWPAILGLVSSDWSQSPELDTQVVNYAPTKNNCPGIAGKVRVCNRKYGFNGWLGQATVWVDSGGHILQGTAKVNDSYFDTGAYNDANAKRHVLCQEVGHTLGLDHQRGVYDTCMNDEGSSLFLAAAVGPNQHDYDELAAIYQHLDAGSTISASTTAGWRSNGAAGGAVVDDAIPPGAGPQDGKVFVRDLGEGRFAVTFVVWAPSSAAAPR